MVKRISIRDNDKTKGMTTLMKLATLLHLNKQWLRLLLSFEACDLHKMKCSVRKNDEKNINYR